MVVSPLNWLMGTSSDSWRMKMKLFLVLRAEVLMVSLGWDLANAVGRFYLLYSSTAIFVEEA